MGKRKAAPPSRPEPFNLPTPPRTCSASGSSGILIQSLPDEPLAEASDEMPEWHILAWKAYRRPEAPETHIRAWEIRQRDGERIRFERKMEMCRKDMEGRIVALFVRYGVVKNPGEKWRPTNEDWRFLAIKQAIANKDSGFDIILNERTKSHKRDEHIYRDNRIDDLISSGEAQNVREAAKILHEELWAQEIARRKTNPDLNDYRTPPDKESLRSQYQSRKDNAKEIPSRWNNAINRMTVGKFILSIANGLTRPSHGEAEKPHSQCV